MSNPIIQSLGSTSFASATVQQAASTQKRRGSVACTVSELSCGSVCQILRRGEQTVVTPDIDLAPAVIA